MPSTVIDKMEYDPEFCVLRIHFRSGLIYEYMDVPAEVFDAMKQAFAKGIYFNDHIKGKYRFRRISANGSQQ